MVLSADCMGLGGLEAPKLDCLSTEPADYLVAADVLSLWSAYAFAKGRAMRLRAEGDVEAALAFERNADATYRKLPVWARW